jgi:signal transduction histidine kinase/ActR/RegA family two-component response regulator
MSTASTLDLMVRLGHQADRACAARELAARIGVEDVLLFVRDPALGAWLPAPGLPQTVRGGPTWRSFISGCGDDGRCSGGVEQPIGVHRPAHGLVRGNVAFVALGGTPAEAALAEVERSLPLVCALLVAEQDALLARAEAAAAHEIASRAQALASALENARAQAAELNAELREEDRRKDEFLAMLGHELRNPLAPLMNSIELLRRAHDGAEIPPKLLEVMSRQITHLTRLVDDLLDASRVSRGRIQLQRETLLLSDVLHDALEETRRLLEQRRHTVIMRGVEEPLAVSGDRVRLMQVFLNLLNNAAKYTEPGGTITLEVVRDGPNVHVRLSDTGIGIAPDMLSRVFELFTQARGALHRAQGGLGIGLTLVRMLVELHGGRASVESGGLGRGSTFSVTLPLVAVPHLPGTPVEPESRHPRSKPMRVLVVDDNRDAADSVALLLREMGHEPEVAYSAQSALELPGRSQADVILLDIGLPGMDGYELARQLRASAKPNARFVALTGFGTPDGARRSRESGFDEHLVKPASAETLRRVLAGVALEHAH